MQFESFSISFVGLFEMFIQFVTRNRFPQRNWYWTVAFYRVLMKVSPLRFHGHRCGESVYVHWHWTWQL